MDRTREGRKENKGSLLSVGGLVASGRSISRRVSRDRSVLPSWSSFPWRGWSKTESKLKKRNSFFFSCLKIFWNKGSDGNLNFGRFLNSKLTIPDGIRSFSALMTHGSDYNLAFLAVFASSRKGFNQRTEKIGLSYRKNEPSLTKKCLF